MKKELIKTASNQAALGHASKLLTNDYIQQSLLIGLPAADYLQVLIRSLKIFDKKINCAAKIKLVSHLNATVSVFQKRHPDADISLFLEQIQNQTRNNHHDVITSLLIRAGLNALARQKVSEPALRHFFDSIVDRLYFNFSSTEPLSHKALILPALGHAVRQHPDLVTGDYFEMSCHFMNIARLPVMRSRAAQYITRAIEENQVINAVHYDVAANLAAVTKAFKSWQTLLCKEHFPVDADVTLLKREIKRVFSGEGIELLQSAMNISMMPESRDMLRDILGQIIELRKYAEPTVSIYGCFKPSVLIPS